MFISSRKEIYQLKNCILIVLVDLCMIQLTYINNINQLKVHSTLFIVFLESRLTFKNIKNYSNNFQPTCCSLIYMLIKRFSNTK